MEDENLDILVVQRENQSWDGENPFYEMKIMVAVLYRDLSFVREFESLDSLFYYRVGTHEALDELFELLEIQIDFDELSDIVLELVPDYNEILGRLLSLTVGRKELV